MVGGLKLALKVWRTGVSAVAFPQTRRMALKHASVELSPSQALAREILISSGRSSDLLARPSTSSYPSS